jgi:DNA (cytosine-5)-methyltransferase 1
MKVGGLFAGIGGIDLGLGRAGFEVIWQVEKDQFCRDVLAKHWPTTPRDVLVEYVGAHNLEECDVICGGFPCQDISTANPDGLGLGG